MLTAIVTDLDEKSRVSIGPKRAKPSVKLNVDAAS